jgi:hypothetical protein
MTNQQHQDGEAPAGDLLIGAAQIKAYLIEKRGMRPTTDPYYLRRIGWPIGKLGGDTGSLVASPRRLDRHIDKLTAAA